MEVPQISSSTTAVAVAPGFAGVAFRAALSMIAGRCSYSARSLKRPLCTMTEVMVQTVKFLDQVQLLGKVVDTPVVRNDRGHGPDRAVPGPGAVTRVVDTPVVRNDRGHGPDRAVPGQGCCYARCFYDRCTWFQTCVNVWRCRRCSSVLLGTSL